MDDEVDVEVPSSFAAKSRAETARNVEQKKKEKPSEPPPRKEPPPPEPSSEGSSSEEDDDEVSDEKSAESPKKEPVKQIPIARSSREERTSSPRAASAVPIKQAAPPKPVVQPTRQFILRQLPIEAQKKSQAAPAQPSKQSRVDEDEVDVEIPQQNYQSSRRSAGHLFPVMSPATESDAQKKQKSQAALTQPSKQSRVDEDEVDVEIPQQNYQGSRRCAGHLSSRSVTSPVTESDNAEIQSDDRRVENVDNSERDPDSQ